jgi:hypothetical protein
MAAMSWKEISLNSKKNKKKGIVWNLFIKFRSQIGIQMCDYRILGASKVYELIV